MTRAVYKYEIPVDDQWHGSTMPLPAQIVHAASQSRGVVCLWAEVAPDSTESAVRAFRVFGTGQPIPEGAVYVGSALDGPYVWHVYAEALKASL